MDMIWFEMFTTKRLLLSIFLEKLLSGKHRKTARTCPDPTRTPTHFAQKPCGYWAGQVGQAGQG